MHFSSFGNVSNTKYQNHEQLVQLLGVSEPNSDIKMFATKIYLLSLKWEIKCG